MTRRMRPVGTAGLIKGGPWSELVSTNISTTQSKKRFRWMRRYVETSSESRALYKLFHSVQLSFVLDEAGQ